MAIVLALISAMTYGVSDYLGGRTARRHPAVVVALLAELTLLVVFVVLIATIESAEPTWRAVTWGAIGGLAGSIGVLGLYRALARGNMTVVAPVTGIVAAAVPVMVGVLTGERPSVMAVIGIVAALVAVALISGVVGVQMERVAVSTLASAVGVGVSFGLLFVAYSQAGDDTGLWPLLSARSTATPLLAIGFLARRRRGTVERLSTSLVIPGVTVGVLVGFANTTYLYATREGLLSIVAVLASMYPVGTVMLAAGLDGERATRSQLIGMVAAAVAVALIAIGS